MPDRPLFERIIVFSLGLIIILIIAKSHDLLPYNRVYLDPDRQKRPFAKEIPGASVAAIAGLVTAGLSSAPKIFDLAREALVALTHYLGW
jgi:hypothetical protein